MKPRFFKTAADFRAWLEQHHGDTAELWVGFYKKASGKGGITYHEGVDCGLCYGWIDGIKKRVDDVSYMHRFTPRRKGSVWSVVNTRRVAELGKLGLMTPMGRAAFERDRKNTKRYTYENASKTLAPEYEKLWKANKTAWAFFNAQPPGYRKLMLGWIGGAVKDETRRKRLQMAIDASAKETRIRWM